MVSMWKRGSVLAILLAVLFVGGACDTTTEPVPQADRLEAEAPDELLGVIREILRETTLELVHRTFAALQEIGTEVISTAGGLLEVENHDLAVPAGAVLHPTVFSMTALEGTTVEVELRAWDVATGEDVGGKGFEKPVQLALSYADVEIDDPSDLVIVRIMPDGSRVPLETHLDRENQQVTAELDHFSRYGLCRN